MEAPRTPFQRRLAEVGDQVASEQLEVKRRTVKSWRLGDRKPRPEQARSIVARWPVTLDDIYSEVQPTLQQAAYSGADRRQQQGG